MEPMICIILIIVVIVIAALGEEISARKSNKTYSQNINFDDIERVCNLFNRYVTEYNNLQQQFTNQYNVKIAEAQTISDIQMMKELLSYNEDFDKYSAVLNQRLENIRGMVNDKQTKHVEDELSNLDEFYSKLKLLMSNLSYVSSNDDFSRWFEQEENKEEYTNTSKTSDSFSFFEGCKTKTEADKRYRALAKAFHPDTGCGDETMFNKMKEEYDNLHLS